MENIKAAIYCRISPFADIFTLTYLCSIQKSLLMEKATATGFDVTDCYEDVGYSRYVCKVSSLDNYAPMLYNHIRTLVRI